LRAESVSCSLDVLYGGLRIRKSKTFFAAINSFKFLVIKALDTDLDRYSAYDAGSGSGLNESGSETLVSGSFHQLTEKMIKTLISTVL
jgi:hypothetical protein